MVESTIRTNELTLPALKYCSTVDTILPVMESIVLLEFGVRILDFVGWLVLFHNFKLTFSSRGVKHCSGIP
jgi:hypothetical protein